MNKGCADITVDATWCAASGVPRSANAAAHSDKCVLNGSNCENPAPIWTAACSTYTE